MKDPATARAGRAGFTLIELMTVIVIIGILAGILIPILFRSKDRVHELAAKDLCAQVAAAWTTLAQNNHRFPSDALVGKYGKSVASSGGDLTFGMDPGVSSVLNWWSAKVPVPEGDVKHFKPKYTMGARKGQEITTFDGNDPSLVQYWPADQLLERSLAMKCYGVYAPWAEREFKAFMEDVLSAGSTGDSQSVKDLQRKWEGSLVHAVIDSNADGKVTIPDAVADEAGLPPDQRNLPMTAAAWVHTRNGRIITSW